jgi:hypothetical protein
VHSPYGRPALAALTAPRREHRRAKTDRLDTELLKRAFLGWLRGKIKFAIAAPPLARIVTVPSSQRTRGYAGRS